MRLGQMEIFGLVFVVLIILVGLFIYITIPKPSSTRLDIGDEYKRTQMATNFIGAVLEVTTECSGQDLWDILAACESPALAGGSLRCPEGRTPCEEAKRVLTFALDNTLGAMQFDYQLSFRVQGSVVFTIPAEALTCQTRVKPGIFPMTSPFTGKTLEVRLEVCG